MIDTEGDLIDGLGGASAVADLLGTNQNTVSNWRKRGFPPWSHRALIRACEEKSLRFSEGLFEARPRRNRAEQAAD